VDSVYTAQTFAWFGNSLFFIIVSLPANNLGRSISQTSVKDQFE